MKPLEQPAEAMNRLIRVGRPTVTDETDGATEGRSMSDRIRHLTHPKEATK